MLSRVNLFKEETRVREQEVRQKWPETRQLQGVPQVGSGWRRHRGDAAGGGGEGTQGCHSEILKQLSVIPLRLRRKSGPETWICKPPGVRLEQVAQGSQCFPGREESAAPGPSARTNASACGSLSSCLLQSRRRGRLQTSIKATLLVLWSNDCLVCRLEFIGRLCAGSETVPGQDGNDRSW